MKCKHCGSKWTVEIAWEDVRHLIAQRLYQCLECERYSTEKEDIEKILKNEEE